MSTTSDLRIAIKYARGASHALLFRLRVDNFMCQGADLTYCSAFPQEREYLYPPGTYLSPTGFHLTVTRDGRTYDVVEVNPEFPS
jgi:hypothetical protein